MNIGFMSNQLDVRGTGNALYNYAHYNEELLGNKSSIYTFSSGRHDKDAYLAFEKRFGPINFISGGFSKLDALYHIKSGYKDGFNPNIPYLVHSVFDNSPHGDVYATISPWMGARFNLPFVPHMVDIFPTDDNLRDQLSIPTGAVVFGRYGGTDSFDISFVWSTISNIILDREEPYFLFMNTNDTDINIYRDNRVIFLPSTVDPYEKRRFINTCDAMIHARARGETFGLAVGEFALAGKPILTYANSPEKAHLQELGNFALTYTDPNSLYKQFLKIIKGPLVSWGYGQYTPENVMKKFKEVFLSNV
jgi:hypothetical protein